MRAPYLIALTYYASYPLSLIYDKALVRILTIKYLGAPLILDINALRVRDTILLACMRG